MPTTISTARFLAQFQYTVTESGATTGSLSSSGQVDIGSKGTFTYGTGASAANKVYVENFTIAGGGSQSWDLSGSLTDPVKNAVVFTKVRGVMVHHSGTSVSSGIKALDTVTNGLMQYPEDLGPGGVFMWVNPSSAGKTVTNSSADIVKVTNNDGTNAATGYVVFLGE